MRSYNEMIEEMQHRRVLLERTIINARKTLERLPEGKLRVSHCKGNPQYYKIDDPSDTRGKYINKSDIKTAQQLAQKDYLKKLICTAEEELASVKRVIGIRAGIEGTQNDRKTLRVPEEVFDSLSSERKIFVSPLMISNEEYARRWSAQPFRISDYKPEEKIYATKRGEMVRSKSEMMIADMYYELGIPYRYECELQLESGECKYPDFTLLDRNTRQVIYHEHFGRMDDEGYRKKNLRKLEEYRKNGIFTGKNLILTFEEDGCPFSIREFERSIRAMLL